MSHASWPRTGGVGGAAAPGLGLGPSLGHEAGDMSHKPLIIDQYTDLLFLTHSLAHLGFSKNSPCGFAVAACRCFAKSFVSLSELSKTIKS